MGLKKYYQKLHEEDKGGGDGKNPNIIINVPPAPKPEPTTPPVVTQNTELEALKIAQAERLQKARDEKLKTDAIEEYRAKEAEKAQLLAIETEKVKKAELIAKVKADKELVAKLEGIGTDLDTVDTTHLNQLLSALGKSFDPKPLGSIKPNGTAPTVAKIGLSRNEMDAAIKKGLGIE